MGDIATVFVVLASYDYEGSDVRAVYATRDAAEQFAEAQRSTSSLATFSVEEWEVR